MIETLQQLPSGFVISLIAVYGLLIGSFLNVLIYRLPRQLPVTFDRSKCPHCQNQLRWYHNLPLVSYLFLLGKCGFCRKSISWVYPLVESLTSLSALTCYLYFGLNWFSLAVWIMSAGLIVIFFIDLEFQIIPDVITIPFALAALAYSFAPGWITPMQSLIGLLVGGGGLYLIAMLGDWLFKKESMGGGDIKMAAMLGAFFGWQKLVLSIMLASVFGLVGAVIMMIVSSKMREERVIPFGPFIALGAVVAILAGDQIVSYYLTTFVTPR